jgi:hypothetical protein
MSGMQTAFAALGCVYAFSLDGGGSASMYVGDRRVSNSGESRQVANGWMVVAPTGRAAPPSGSHAVTIDGINQGTFPVGGTVELPVPVLAGYSFRGVKGLTEVPTVFDRSASGNTVRFTMPDRAVGIETINDSVPNNAENVLFSVHKVPQNLFQWRAGSWITTTSSPMLFRDNDDGSRFVGIHSDIAGTLAEVSGDRTDGSAIVTFANPERIYAVWDITATCAFSLYVGTRPGSGDQDVLVSSPAPGSFKGERRLTDITPGANRLIGWSIRLLNASANQGIDFTLDFVERNNVYTVSAAAGLTFVNPDTLAVLTQPPASFTVGQTVVLEIRNELGDAGIIGFGDTAISRFSSGGRNFVSFAMSAGDLSLQLSGHVMGRDSVTVADAALAFRGLLGLVALTPEQEARVAFDGEALNISHVLRIFRYALGLSTA